MEVKSDDTIAGAGYFAGSGHIDGRLLRRLAARIAAFGDREELWGNMPFTGEGLGAGPRCTGEDVTEAAGGRGGGHGRGPRGASRGGRAGSLGTTISCLC